MARRIVTQREQYGLLNPTLREAGVRSAMPWYHTTDADLPAGTNLTPSGGPSRFEDFYKKDPEWGEQARGKVWMMPSVDDGYLNLWRGNHTYEVEPADEPQMNDGGEYGASSARIVRRIPDPDLEPRPHTAKMNFPYLRNNGGMRDTSGFDQDAEPWGRYMSEDQAPRNQLQKGWERGNVSFENPLLVPHNYGAWKQELSQAHGGLTGQNLSDALLAKGHDGVITHDKYGLGEIVDIRPKDQRGHHTASLRTANAMSVPVEHLVPHSSYDQSEPGRVQELADDMGSNGVSLPVTLETDGRRGWLQDGNHRLDAAQSLGMTHLPTRFKWAEPKYLAEGDAPELHPSLQKQLSENPHLIQDRVERQPTWYRGTGNRYTH